MTRRPATVLGFDYGYKRIGVAVGQTLTGTATPLGIVRVSARTPDWEAIAELIRVWQPDTLVVGMPLNMDGTEQATTHAARRFADELGAHCGLPVHTADERLTTVEARRRLAQAGRAVDAHDPVAAQVILEAWLDEQRLQQVT